MSDFDHVITHTFLALLLATQSGQKHNSVSTKRLSCARYCRRRRQRERDGPRLADVVGRPMSSTVSGKCSGQSSILEDK